MISRFHQRVAEKVDMIKLSFTATCLVGKSILVLNQHQLPDITFSCEFYQERIETIIPTEPFLFREAEEIIMESEESEQVSYFREFTLFCIL